MSAHSSSPQPHPLPLPPPDTDVADAHHPKSLPSIDKASKRLRRPSLRVGDNGDYPACQFSESHQHRGSKNVEEDHKDSVANAAKYSSKTQSLTNPELHRPRGGGRDDKKVELLDTEGRGRAETQEEKTWRVGGPIGTLLKTNWFSSGLQDAPSEDGRDGRFFVEEGGEVEEGGVRRWLEGLGLERYAPVLDFHEVDDEVLPLLTLEDLKEMGINAVGSRRKMYRAIQRLGRHG